MKKSGIFWALLLTIMSSNCFKQACINTPDNTPPNPKDLPEYWHLSYEDGLTTCFITFSQEEIDAFLNAESIKTNPHFYRVADKDTSTTKKTDPKSRALAGIFMAGALYQTIGYVKARLMKPTHRPKG